MNHFLLNSLTPLNPDYDHLAKTGSRFAICQEQSGRKWGPNRLLCLPPEDATAAFRRWFPRKDALSNEVCVNGSLLHTLRSFLSANKERLLSDSQLIDCDRGRRLEFLSSASAKSNCAECFSSIKKKKPGFQQRTETSLAVRRLRLLCVWTEMKGVKFRLLLKSHGEAEGDWLWCVN